MKVVLIYSSEDDEIWAYIQEGNEPLPFLIKPRKEKKDEEDSDEIKEKVH